MSKIAMESPLIVSTSPYSVGETADRIEHILNSKKVTLFCRINHSQAAKDEGLDMSPEELLIFGSPKVGTPLMLENPSIGIELPLKVIIWQKDNKTFVGCQNLEKNLRDYQISVHKDIIGKMQSFLDSLISQALQK